MVDAPKSLTAPNAGSVATGLTMGKKDDDLSIETAQPAGFHSRSRGLGQFAH
jgi:hypothetical protein